MVDVITQNLAIWTSALENKSTVGRGTNNKQMAYGIKKLRELILELAVRGKLVPQDPNDEPAAELLKKIQAEKEQLTATGKLRKQKPLRAIDKDEVPSISPSKWKWERLGNLSTMITKGSTPTSYGHIFTEIGINFIKVESIKQGLLLSENVTSFISEETHNFLARSQLEAGDILFSIAGSIGTCAVVTKDVLPANTNQALAIIRGTKYVYNPAFLLNCIQSSVAQIVLNKARGGAMNNVSLEDIQNFVIPLPPLAEQHRIVAKVDELMALCDQLEQQQTDSVIAHQMLVETLLKTLTESENAEQLAQNWAILSEHFDTLFTTEHSIDQFKQTILQLAVMGKLAPQDPNDEPASELLKRIQAEKAKLIAEGKIKKDKPLSPITEEEKPFVLPQGWEWVRLEDLMPEFQNGASSRGDSGGESVVVLRLADIKDRRISLEQPRELLISPNMIDKYRLSMGDILVVRVNGSADLVGGFVVCELNFDGIYCDHFIRMRIPQKILNPRFLALVGASQLVRDRIKDLFVTTAGQKTVNQGHIGSLIIPLCSVVEQHRIVAKVDELMALCGTLKAQINKAQTTQIHLANAIIEQSIA